MTNLKTHVKYNVLAMTNLKTHAPVCKIQGFVGPSLKNHCKCNVFAMINLKTHVKYNVFAMTNLKTHAPVHKKHSKEHE